MNYRSVIKKLGTLLYPKTSNVLRCLTLALHEMDTVHGYDNSGVEDKEILLKRSGNMVNDLLHDEITKLKSSQIDLTSFDLSSSISSTNNLLWQFICSCTQSVWERTGRKNQDDAHVKTVRSTLLCRLHFLYLYLYSLWNLFIAFARCEHSTLLCRLHFLYLYTSTLSGIYL